jgi:hypothetical protein
MASHMRKAAERDQFQPERYSARASVEKGGWTAPRIIACVLLVVIALAGLCCFDLYRSSRAVLDEADDVMTAVDDLKAAVKKGDAEALAQVTETMVDSAHSIQGAVHSPAWYLASLVPGYGSDVHSIQVLSDVFVDLADNALTPIAANPMVMNYKDVFSDGAVDLVALQSLSASLEEAAPVFLRSADKITALPKANIEKLDTVLSKVQDGVGSASGMIELVQSMLPHLNTLLGAGQTKNYLIVAYTNAELRSSGGFPGSWTLVTVKDGKIAMGKTVTLQQKEDDFIVFREDEKAAFPGVSGNMGSIPFLPDFTFVGYYMAQGYEHHRNVHINGVVAIDPVFLQRVLELTGGVTASDGTLVDGTNAAWELMSNAYWRFGNEGKKQDQFFAEVASLSFDKLMHSLGKVSITDLFNMLMKSAEDHRLQIWMEDEGLQQLFMEYGFSGKIPDDPTRPEVGVYLNDNTWAKIGWYTKVDTSVSEPVENGDGSKTYDVVTTITNSAWDNELEYSPRYVWGYNWPDKRTDSDMILFPLIMAPAGGSISDMQTEGYGGLGHYTLYGLDAYTGVMHADVGESIVLRYKVTTSPEATELLTVRKTPLAQERLLSVEYAWDEE